MEKFEKNTRKRLRKEERLSSKKLINLLFTEGSSFKTHHFVIRYIIIPEEYPLYHQLLVSVSKRNFKLAVVRNKLKRQIRESYRLNKHLINDLSNKYAIAYIYTGKKTIPYKDLEKELISSLRRLKKELV